MNKLWMAALLMLAGCNGNKPGVLVIGDSTSIGWTPYVQQELSGRYDVMHSSGTPDEGNAEYTGYTLEHLQEWLDNAGPVDIIHYNNGLWDMVHTTGPKARCHTFDGHRTDLPEYRDNLEHIAAALEKTGAKIIWATTTEVPQGNICITPSDVPVYNAVLVDVAHEHGFAVDDLYSVTSTYGLHLVIDRRPQAHFQPQGYELLSYQVSQSIETVAP